MHPRVVSELRIARPDSAAWVAVRAAPQAFRRFLRVGQAQSPIARIASMITARPKHVAAAPVVGSHSRVGSGSSLDELLSAVDVEGRAGDRRVRHEVDGQCGYVGRTDDPSDWQDGTELLAARVQLVPEEPRR